MTKKLMPAKAPPAPIKRKKKSVLKDIPLALLVIVTAIAFLDIFINSNFRLFLVAFFGLGALNFYVRKHYPHININEDETHTHNVHTDPSWSILSSNIYNKRN